MACRIIFDYLGIYVHNVSRKKIKKNRLNRKGKWGTKCHYAQGGLDVFNFYQKEKRGKMVA